MSRRRPALAAALVAATFAATVLAGGAPAAAAAAPCWDDVITDFDGDGPDVVVGLPSFDLPGKPDAGAIVVYSNVAEQGDADPKLPTATTLLTADDFDGLDSESGARFGAAVEVWLDAGDFDDADDCADLLVGAPGQTVGGKAAAGQVYLLGGAPGGLGAVDDVFDEATISGTGGAQAGAGFGSALTADTLGAIAIGAPGRNVGGVSDAGRVVRLNNYGTDLPQDVFVLEQGGLVGGAAEANDRFGEVLSMLPSGVGDILVVGVPHEDVGSRADAGVVTLVPQDDPASNVSQDSPGAAGAAEAGDLYGSSIDSYGAQLQDPDYVAIAVAIGVPGEDVGGKVDVGQVSYAGAELFVSASVGVGPLRGWARTAVQGSNGVVGAAEAGDRFGSAVAVGEFGSDTGTLQLAVGAPLEDVSGVADGGVLTSTRIENDGSQAPGPQPGPWTQNSVGVPGQVESGDRFGAAIASTQLTTLEDDDDTVWEVLLVTVPREDVEGVVDAGMAYLGYAPGFAPASLWLPTNQAGAGIGMVPMRMVF